jgi:hypothetical protein
MAEQIVSPSNDARTASVTIPAQYVERFRVETELALRSAAERITELVVWREQARDRDEQPQHVVNDDDLAKFEAAARVFRQARDQEEGELQIEGAVKTLHSAAVGVLLDVSEAIPGEAERREPDFGPVLEEFGFWRELRERLDGEED